MRKLSKVLFGVLMITNLCLTSCTATSIEEDSEVSSTTGGTVNDEKEKPDDD